MVLGLCLMMCVVGLFGLLLLLSGLRGFVARRTWIQGGVLHQRARLFGIPWSRRVSCRNLDRVHHGDLSSSGGKTWYDVVIERNTTERTGRIPWRCLFSRITVATNVPSEREADELVQRLRAELRGTRTSR